MQLIGIRSPHQFACVLDDQCVSLCTHTRYFLSMSVYLSRMLNVLYIYVHVYTLVCKSTWIKTNSQRSSVEKSGIKEIAFHSFS